MKISLIRKFISSIWRTCIDSKAKPNEVSKMFKEPMERVIFDKLREDGIEAFKTKLVPGEPLYEFLSPSNKEEQDFEITQGNKDSIIIMIHWIGAFLNTCYYPQTRRCALEILMQVGRASSLDVRLQYILPYVLKMFDDKQSKVQAKAIEVAVMMFENLIDSNEELTLNSTDYKVFDNYIMPAFMHIQKRSKNDQLV